MESDVRPPKRLRLTDDEYEHYDVFLSHRGPETKTGFVGFLYEALEAAGLRPFLDCESIDKGQDAWTCIEHAIKTTPIALVIFSESFAQSEWCVKELHVMLDTPGVKVLPVFYNVQPRELSFPEKGQLAAGFEKLKGRHDEIRIGQWRDDLSRAAKLNGWEQKATDQRLERDLVKEIVGKVFDLANKPLPLDVGEHVVGVDRVAEEIIRKLDEAGTVLMLGLWGMGGIGKSTLARELYNRLRKRFDSACYIEDVTDKVMQGGVEKVQNSILEDLCVSEAKDVKDKSKGKIILEERLCRKRILLVLDDVRDSEEMSYWISRKMLTKGSMCIVTSRNRRVVEESISFDVNREVHIHDVRVLSRVDSSRVFASYAFGGFRKVTPVFEELVEDVSGACGGIPLVLKVCGALLKGEEDVHIWEEVIKKLKCRGMMDEKKIFECLRISYDALPEQQQEMFLDVACGLLGESVDFSIRVWRSLEWSAALGVRSLVEKALITVDGKGCFGMHDHLRDMGREIVRRRTAIDGVCRRLWMPESLSLLMENGRLPDSLQTLSIFSYNGSNVLDLDVSYMRDLRILICNIGRTCVTSLLPKHLRWLGRSEVFWELFREELWTFAAALQNNKLVILDLEFSWVQNLPEAFGELSKLEVLNLSGCHGLAELPDSFGRLKSLRDLRLRSCRIRSIPESFGELSKLELLNLDYCAELTFLPNSFERLKRLRDLKLEGSEIQSLPESFGELSNLEVLNLGTCRGLTSLPNSFGDLVHLRDLMLTDCGIQSLPESFGDLSKLELLYLNYCVELTLLPNSFGGLKKLRELKLAGSGIQGLPESFGKLSNLESLDLRTCRGLTSLPTSFWGLKSLRDLKLEGSRIKSLPESFGDLSNLHAMSNITMWNVYKSLIVLPNSLGCFQNERALDLADFRIETLPEAFGDLVCLKVLNLRCCEYLIFLPSSFGKLSNLMVLDLRSCCDLISLPDSFGGLGNLRSLRLDYSGIERLPESFGDLSLLERLGMRRCRKIVSLPSSFGRLSRLEELNLRGCEELIRLPDSFGSLRSLRTLSLGRSRMESLPESFGDLNHLQALDLSNCLRLRGLPQSLTQLGNLQMLNLQYCPASSTLSSIRQLMPASCKVTLTNWNVPQHFLYKK